MRVFVTKILLLGSLFFLLQGAAPTVAQAEQVSVLHYFSDHMGQAGFKALLQRFTKERQIAVVDNPVGHEEFKTVVLQMAAEGQLPGVVSYWAGARTQFLVDSGVLAPVDDLWQRRGYDSLLLPSLAATATVYNGRHYLIPFGYHAVGFFYSPGAFQAAGIARPPQNWDEFLTACQLLQQHEIPPLALGARNRWPAQFWFDYLLLRTAGVEFRQKLMTGKADYVDPLVQQAMQIWADLLAKNYFAEGSMIDDWTDAADQVVAGHAGMTLMGSWVVGFLQEHGAVAGTDYDFFPFPTIDPQQPRAVVGPVDGWIMGAGAPDRSAAERLIDFLLTDIDIQYQWSLAQGALSPNRNVSTDLYNPVIKKVAAEVEKAQAFVFNYDLAASPPAAEQGLIMFGKFLAQPTSYQQLLRETEALIGPVSESSEGVGNGKQ